MSSTFSCTCWPFVYLLWKNIYSVPLSNFELDCLLFCSWVVLALCIFWILTPYQIYELQMIPPIPQVASSFCWWFCLLCRSFSVQCSPTCLFLFWCCLLHFQNIFMISLFPTTFTTTPGPCCCHQSSCYCSSILSVPLAFTFVPLVPVLSNEASSVTLRCKFMMTRHCHNHRVSPGHTVVLHDLTSSKFSDVFSTTLLFAHAAPVTLASSWFLEPASNIPNLVLSLFVAPAWNALSWKCAFGYLPHLLPEFAKMSSF